MSGNGDDDRDLFSRAMAEVQPLSRRDERVVGPAADVRGVRLDESDTGPPLLQVTTDGIRVEGVASGADDRTLRRLRAGGSWPPEETLDLHGLRRGEALQALSAALTAAWSAGLRCIRVITGRGRGSDGGVPVLRAAAVQALARRPEVLAFTTASARDGGAGALYVLLRRGRAG